MIAGCAVCAAFAIVSPDEIRPLKAYHHAQAQPVSFVELAKQSIRRAVKYVYTCRQGRIAGELVGDIKLHNTVRVIHVVNSQHLQGERVVEKISLDQQ